MKAKILKSIPALLLFGLVSCASEAAIDTNKPIAETTKSEVATASNSAVNALSPVENNQIAVQMFEGAWNEGDFSVIDKFIKADAVDHSPLGSEEGSDGFKKIIGMFRSAMPELKMTIQDEIYARDRVVHSWKIQGKHTGTPLFGVPASGKEITLTGITIVRIEGGQIAERWTQLDQLGLMIQLGLVPPPGEQS